MPDAARKRRNRSDVLNDADLIVDVHDRHQHRVRAQRRGHLRRIQHAVADRESGRSPAIPRRSSSRHGSSTALCSVRAVTMCRPLLAVVVGDAEDREVVRLGRARCPNDFGGFRAHRRRHLGARRFHQRIRRLAVIVADGRRDCRTHPRAVRHSAMRAATSRRRPAWSPHSPGTRGRGDHSRGRRADWPRRPCTALKMPRMMLSSLRSSCARLKRRRSRSIRCPVRSSKSISLSTWCRCA